MSIKVWVCVSGLVLSSPIWSFNCYFTLAKGSCWKNFDVTVEVVDSVSSNVLTRVLVPKGEEWGRQKFTCEPGQKLMYKAQFSPVIWESDKGKTYSALRFLSLPNAIKPNEKAWVVSACFPDYFSGVPLPSDATSNCACDFSKIPALDPE